MMSYINKNNLMPERSRLFCPIERTNEEMYFSLVDYRNNYFTSNDPNKIIEFYNGFENRDQLILWMKERPKGVANLREVEGDKEIIVVIPTADFNGKYARECRENIFKGLHIVFVESGGRGDFYFNYAHNCNVGIRKAMEYNPKWIIMSNDDVDKVDDIGVLKQELSKLDSKNIDFVACEPSYGYHSTPVKIMYPNKLGILIYSHKFLRRYSRSVREIIKRIKLTLCFTLIDTSMVHNIKISRIELFRIKFLANFFFYNTKISFYQIGAFGIVSGTLVNELSKKLYNENYINGSEDIDLSYRIQLRGNKVKKIHYNIRPKVGATLGSDILRDMKNIVGRVLLCSMLTQA